MMKTGILRGV
jgi:hypothetical protein